MVASFAISGKPIFSFFIFLTASYYIHILRTFASSSLIAKCEIRHSFIYKFIISLSAVFDTYFCAGLP